MKPGYTYIMGSDTGVLYVGVTSDMYTRTHQHKNHTFEGFSKQYNCHRLLYYEGHESINQSLAREKQLKGWSRAKKIALIEKTNATWQDLSKDWFTEEQLTWEPA